MRGMKGLLAAVGLVTALGFAGCSSSDDKPDYSGTWDFVLSMGTQQVPMEVTVSIVDGDTTGTFTVLGRPGTISGRTDGDRIDWLWRISGSACSDARMTGEFDSDTHGSGQLTVADPDCGDDGQSYPWTATKR